MPRVLLVAATTGYQTRSFGEAAERLGVDLALATDRCHVLEDPWRDHAVPVRFEDEEGSVAAIVAAALHRPIDGVLAVGDRPAVVAAHLQEALGLRGHPPSAAKAARNKLSMRGQLSLAGLPVPWFQPAPVTGDPHELARSVRYPCVVKPLALSGSRGVIRADDPAQLVAACYRLRALVQSPDIRAERNPETGDLLLVEGFIEGREYAVEGVLTEGAFRPFAIFDKPDPLDGPFFEETIYVTPSAETDSVRAAIVDAIARAARAIGLWHGPVHGECRVNARGVYVLEVAARPIGGLCARALRFQKNGSGEHSLEEVLLRHALGEPCDSYRRETRASGVMMVPIPRRGILRQVFGLDEARQVAHVEDVRITAKPDQLLVPLPEGASYLGFIFARAGDRSAVVDALAAAHRHLGFAIDPEVRMLQSAHG